MDETTEQPTTDGTAPTQWCSWHGRMAPALPVQVIEEGDARGGIMWACRECRQVYRLWSLDVQNAWAALFAHLAGEDNRGCGPCNRFEECETGDALRETLREAREADKAGAR